jgi:hypothetical protein
MIEEATIAVNTGPAHGTGMRKYTSGSQIDADQAKYTMLHSTPNPRH